MSCDTGVVFTDADRAYIASALEAVMVDTGQIIRPSGTGTLDDATGLWSADAGTVVYDGKCSIVPGTAAAVEDLFGAEQIATVRYIGKFPTGTPAMRDDRVVVTSGSDPQIGAAVFRVIVVAVGSNHVQRICGLELVE